MIPTVVTSKPEMVAAIRRRRDELAVTHETIDEISGMAGGYTSKLLAPEPIKGFGEMSLGSVLGALALGIAAVIIIEDPDQVERIGDRWVKRKRPQKIASAGISASMSHEAPATIQTTPVPERKPVDLQHMKTIAKLGGKRRAKILGKRARHRIATHAARTRWAKRGCMAVRC